MTEVPAHIIDKTLRLKIAPNMSGKSTIHEYLLELLGKVWIDTEFTSKRPFGYSGWKSVIEIAMVDADIVNGVIDEYGYLDEVDENRATEIILACISSLDFVPGE
jgi:hypothetical protein